MPTIPERRSGPPTKPYQARQVAESFGVDPERYDRARPRYPAALIAQVVDSSPGLAFLDVGCGTGIEARQFQVAGATVLGVDPDARMAELARRSGVDVEVATFEAWDPAGRSFDAVVAGQSWHWVDPVAGAAKAAQILRPGGRLAVFAHVFHTPPEAEDALAAALRRVAPELPWIPQPPAGSALPRTALDTYRAMFAKFVDGIRQAGGFDEPEQWSFGGDRAYTRDEWLDLLPTTGGLIQLSSDHLREVLELVERAIEPLGDSFTMTCTTLAATATRTASTAPGRTPVEAGQLPASRSSSCS